MRIDRTARFKRAYRKLSDQQQDRAKKEIRLLVDDPRHPSLRVKKVKGTAGIWEARVDRRIRMTFARVEGGFLLRNIDDHDAALGNP